MYGALADVLSYLISYVFKGLVDSTNSSLGGDPRSSNIVFLWVLAFPLIHLLVAVLKRADSYVTTLLNTYAVSEAAKKIFEYLSAHSLSYFNDRFSGALSEKANTTSSNIRSLVNIIFGNILTLLVSFVVTSVLLFSSNIMLGVLFVCGFIGLIPVNFFLTRKQNILTDKATEAIARFRGQIIDTLTNISAVQQYARRSFEIDRLDITIKASGEANLKKNNYSNNIYFINNVLVGLFIGAIVLFSFNLWRQMLITTGTLVMVVTLTRTFVFGLIAVGSHINNLVDTYSQMKNGLRDIVQPHEIIDRPNAKKLVVGKQEVVFDNVTFAYDKDPRKIFDKLSFEVKGGQKVGVVGTSGAGKSTVMKLLLRQHDLVGGSIRIDGQDISTVTQESLRENVSIVPQEPMLFHRTIRENIMYGKLDATEEEMIEVAKKAQAHDFIERLPQKYDSLVGERGVKLSVGQRQRIAIARAFLKNAPILILDEATSALDSESEVAVQKALQTLMEGKTVFAIAHRLSTLREMDRILVFKDGQIAEDGTHRTLLKNKEGVYASFWAHQAGGFIKED